MTGERYKTISKETQGILKGEYGAAPAPFNKSLQDRVLDGKEAITCRPADLLESEFEKLTAELNGLAQEKGIKLADQSVDDVLTYALFPQVGLKFLQNRGNPDAFEPAPGTEPEVKPAPVQAASADNSVYTVRVNGNAYTVQVSEGGDVTQLAPVSAPAAQPETAGVPVSAGEPMPAPLAGNIWKVNVTPGQNIQEGDVLLILEAMKMETEVRAPRSGQVTSVGVREGDSVAVGDTLLALA